MDYLFSGLKVVDCATVIAAPAAAMMLADYGADVIKIEPVGGDPVRARGPFWGTTAPDPDRSLPWIAANVGKRSLVLDLAGSEEDVGVGLL